MVGLGPGDPGLLTVSARQAIDAIAVRYLRTERHPSASAVAPAVNFDPVYEGAATIEEVYTEIVDLLVDAADRQGEVLYAVPGSPLVAERTVELLRADPRVETVVLPAMSFLDLAWDRLEVDPVQAGVRLVDGHCFEQHAAGHAGPFLVAQCDSAMVLSDIKLSVDDGPRVVVLQRLGLADETVVSVAWDDLDRLIDADHLTCVWIPELAEPVAASVARFAELVRTLRARCPWDQAQTHKSLTRHLLEETYEVLEAIGELETPEGWDHLQEELGDLLFQVVFHATLAAEAGQFTLSDVAIGITDKLIGRHPHVFAPDEPARSWEQIKAAEKGRTSAMEGIPADLPALLYAHKVQRKAASVGFDWDGVSGAWPRVAEELAELQAAMTGGDSGAITDELGDLLFAVVNLARHLQVDPEAALRGATAKFRRRFLAVEALAATRGSSMDSLDLAALDALWDEVKRTSA